MFIDFKIKIIINNYFFRKGKCMLQELNYVALRREF